MKRMLKLTLIGFLCFQMFPILAPQIKAETGWWTTKTSLPHFQALSGAAGVNGKIYVIGGQYKDQGQYVWLNTNYEYDPLSDSWASKASMSTKRTTLSVVSVNDKIYAIGGVAGVSGGAFSTNEEFDPVSNSWTLKAPMPTQRNWITGAVVNGKIYIIGGSDNSGGFFSMNEVYDPLTDTWTTKKPIPHVRLAYGIGVVNNKIYVIGGWVRPGAPPGEPTTLNEEYDPQMDTWTTKAPMPTARNGLTVAVVDNKIYAIGGATDFNPWTHNLNVVEEYDPSTDTWKAVQSMPTPRSMLSAVAIDNKIYAIGGMGSTGYLDTNEQFSTQNSCSLILMPSTGFASTTVTGSRFSSNSKIIITWDSTEIPTVPSPLLTDANGNFTALISTFTQNAPGVHTVNVTDASGNWASATFTVVDVTGPQGPKGDPGEGKELSIIIVAFTAGASILAICFATIALLKKKT